MKVQGFMSYIYSEHRHTTFSEEGQVALCKALLAAREAGRANGLVTHEQIAAAFHIADSWAKLAIVDRLVELGYLAVAGRDGTRQEYIYRWTGDRT